MCTHIHQNHTAFVESIKNKIRLTTIQEYKDDAPNFLRALQDDLGLISSMGNIDAENNDLIPHILLQLQCTKIPLFQQAILHWHRQYMEGKLQLTPLRLIQMADEESQILKHSQQWVEKIGPSTTALQAQLEEKSQTSLDVIKHITAHLGFTPSSRAPPGNHYYSPHYSKENKEKQMLDGRSFYDVPIDLFTPRYYEGRYWYFCSKCGKNGQWVCTHCDDTHTLGSSVSSWTQDCVGLS
jgi:hypothetical protein